MASWRLPAVTLGFCFLCVGLGFIAGSTYFVLYTVLGVMPVHINLVYFEELELEIRFGERYQEYRRQIPFLISRFAKSRQPKGS